MQDIINYIEINENISTSGQPTQEQFKDIRNLGFEVVINLAVSTSEGKLENEDDIVSSLGMNYIHIPVDFEYPTQKNLKDFIEILTALSHKKVWVHCILNHRVTAFMYVYHKYVLRTPFEEVDLSVFDEWTPDERWKNIMKTSADDLV